MTTRSGKVGSPGQSRRNAFEADYQATSAAREQVTAKTKAGYLEKVGTPPAPKRNQALEKAIIADPTDEAADMVYADWLQAHGDANSARLAGGVEGARELLQIGDLDRGLRHGLDGESGLPDARLDPVLRGGLGAFAQRSADRVDNA